VVAPAMAGSMLTAGFIGTAIPILSKRVCGRQWQISGAGSASGGSDGSDESVRACARTRELPLRSARLLRRLGFDLAATAGPFETAFQDVVGFSVFPRLASLLLRWLR
jgi:hypothetical protein